MSRYIDADALLNDLQPLFVHNGNLKDEWMSYCVEKIIREQPTVDVVEVVHGEWIEHDDALVSGHCSVCGWESIICETDVIGMNYCPNCGADMRGGKDAKIH